MKLIGKDIVLSIKNQFASIATILNSCNKNNKRQVLKEVTKNIF